MTYHLATMTQTDDGWDVYCPACGRHIRFDDDGMTVLASGNTAVQHAASAGGVHASVDAHEYVPLNPDIWGEGAND